MKIKNLNWYNNMNYTIIRFPDNKIIKQWCIKKHYAGKVPQVSYGFGLMNQNKVVGIITFGVGANYRLKDLCHGKYNTLEFNRLCIDLPKNERKNVATWFCSRAIKQLPQPTLLVSYADSGQNHVGYIYQALNWHYTGEATSVVWERDGIQYHRRTICGLYNTDKQYEMESLGYKKIICKPKYRYVYFHGNKRQKKEMKNDFKLTLLSYPKGNIKHYNCSTKIKPIMMGFLPILNINQKKG